MKQTGTVKWYDPAKAYGFLTTENGQDVFTHRSAIADGRPYLIDGQRVEFSMRQGMKGLEAEEVRVTQDVEGVPPSRLSRYQEATYADSYDHRDRMSRSGEFRGSGARSSRDSYGGRRRDEHTGPIPHEPLRARVVRIDPNRRFLFAHVDVLHVDVYVHSSLFSTFDLREGDQIWIAIERSERGLRARSLELD